MSRSVILAVAAFAAGFCASAPPEPPATFDMLIRHGTVYDGAGQPGRKADVGIRGDKIAAIGDLTNATAKTTIDATGLAVAPGFINMLSWSTESLLADGKSQSEIRQGVTTQIMGEGESMGPVNDAIRARMKREQTDIKYEIEWRTLGEYLVFPRARACRKTSHRSSGPRPSANMSSAGETSNRRPSKWSGCAGWSIPKCATGRWASRRRWNTHRPITPTPRN